jgi:hypothetical protein
MKHFFLILPLVSIAAGAAPVNFQTTPTAGVPCIQGQNCALGKQSTVGGQPILSVGNVIDVSPTYAACNTLPANCNSSSPGDDTAGIQAAFNAALGNGYTVRFNSPNTCVMKGYVTIPAGVTVIGNVGQAGGIGDTNVTICALNNTVAYAPLGVTPIFVLNNNAGNVIENLSMSNQVLGATNYGLVASSNDGLVLNNVLVEGFYNNIWINTSNFTHIYAGQSQEAQYRDLWLTGDTSIEVYGMLLSNSGIANVVLDMGGGFPTTGVLLDVALQDEATGDGIDVLGASNVIIREAMQWNANGTSILITDGGTGPAPRNIRIEDLQLEPFQPQSAGPFSYGIHCVNGSNVTLQNVRTNPTGVGYSTGVNYGYTNGDIVFETGCPSPTLINVHTGVQPDAGLVGFVDDSYVGNGDAGISGNQYVSKNLTTGGTITCGADPLTTQTYFQCASTPCSVKDSSGVSHFQAGASGANNYESSQAATSAAHSFASQTTLTTGHMADFYKDNFSTIKAFLDSAGLLWSNSQPVAPCQHGSDAGTTGVLSVTFSTAFVARPDCTCSTEGNFPCGPTVRTTTGAQFQSVGATTDVLDWVCCN